MNNLFQNIGSYTKLTETFKANTLKEKPKESLSFNSLLNSEQSLANITQTLHKEDEELELSKITEYLTSKGKDAWLDLSQEKKMR